MNNYFIIHGSFSSPFSNWIPYLRNEIANKQIAGVAMDGFYNEPITKETNDKYLKLKDEDYIITPHNAYNSIDAVKQMERMIIESLEDVKNGSNVRNVV